MEEQAKYFHCYARSEGVAGVIISDKDYGSRPAHSLLSKVVDEFLSQHPPATWRNSDAKVNFPVLKEYLQKYQDAEQADSM